MTTITIISHPVGQKKIGQKNEIQPFCFVCSATLICFKIKLKSTNAKLYKFDQKHFTIEWTK